MPNEIIPSSPGNLLAWLNNLDAELPTVGPAIGMAPAAVTALLAKVDALKPSVQAVTDAAHALDLAKSTLAASLANQLEPLRKDINVLKTAPNFNDNAGKTLDVLSHASPHADPHTYKPVITVSIVAGHPRIMGRKRGVKALNFYTRLDGQIPWKLLRRAAGTFPFIDDTPLAQAGVPEKREYMAMGLIADEEIGQPSDIVSVLYGG